MFGLAGISVKYSGSIFSLLSSSFRARGKCQRDHATIFLVPRSSQHHYIDLLSSGSDSWICLLLIDVGITRLATRTRSPPQPFCGTLSMDTSGKPPWGHRTQTCVSLRGIGNCRGVSTGDVMQPLRCKYRTRCPCQRTKLALCGRPWGRLK